MVMKYNLVLLATWIVLSTILLVLGLIALRKEPTYRSTYLTKLKAKMVRQTEEERTQHVWRNADAVCFDVDSTAIMDEGLDELANFLGKGEAIANLTNQAMGGSMTFRESLELRLDLLRPNRKSVKRFLLEGSMKLTHGIVELVEKLHANGVDVYLVSGGFEQLIIPVAEALDIPRENIFANNLLFDQHGHYKTFDRARFTSASGGKARVAQHLLDKHQYENLVFIGDGATDLEAFPPAHAFIGFGGNVVRTEVRKNAKWFVKDLHTLLHEL